MKVSNYRADKQTKHARCFKIYVFCCDTDFVIITVYEYFVYSQIEIL